MSRTIQIDEPFLLGSWEVHPGLNRMVKGSKIRKLRPQVMRLLIYLVHRRGEVVSNNQMLEEFWTGRVVSSASIYVTVAQLRRALADIQNVRIETIPRSGYRLVAPAPQPISEAGPEAVQTAGEQTATGPFRSGVSRNRKRVLFGAWATLLIGVTLGAGLIWSSFRQASDAPGVAETDLPHSVPRPGDVVPIIAVLPLRNLSAADEDAFFADGVHEEILTQLSRLPDVDVISRSSVTRFSEELPNLPEVARMLNATHVVEGSVRRAGNTVRITVQLIDAASDKHLWAETYDRELQDIFAIQTDVAVQIAHALDSAVSPESLPSQADFGTDSLEAYELYVRARQLGRDYNPDGLREQQVKLLREALRIDPDYPHAWQLLARAEASAPFAGADPDGSHLQRAEEAVRQAKRIAPDSTDTMIAEAFVLYWGKQQLDAALAVVREARRIEPRRAELLQLQGWIVQRLGQFDEARNLQAQASRLDPLNAQVAQVLGQVSLWAGRYEEARRAFLRAYQATPGPGLTDRYALEAARIFVSPTYEAWRNLQESHLERLLQSGEPLNTGYFALFFLEYLVMSGQRQQAWRFTRREGGRINAGDRRSIHPAYWETAALAFIGEEEDARSLAEQTLSASLEWSSNPDNLAKDGSWLRRQGSLHKAWLGAFLGRDEIAAEGLASLKEDIERAKDALSRQFAIFFYIEGLLASDPELAHEVYLNESILFIQPHDIATRPHFFYRLLGSPEVRARFEDHPAWVQFMRDSWPESREFPFD